MFRRIGEKPVCVDPELQAIIPPLLPEEKKQLEDNLAEYGCLDPLKVWTENLVIIDGHNRHEICERRGWSYQVEYISFDSRDEVIDWMIDNQLGRRNLTREQQKYLRGLQYNREKAKGPGAPTGNGNAEKQYDHFDHIVLDDASHPKTTAARLASQHKVSQGTIQRDGKFAESLDTIASVAGPEIKDAILSRQTYATEQDVKAIADAAKATPNLVQKLVQKQQEETGAVDAKALRKELGQLEEPPVIEATLSPGKMAVHFSSDSPEHYTPRHVINAAIECMGGIDLDPCSNSHHSPNVPAGSHYTKDDNGLLLPWEGRVYMNPPYGREIGSWVNKLCEEHESGLCTQAIALVPARTDTQWFNRMNDYLCCLVVGRLTFIGNDDAAPFPSAVFYLGDDTAAFYHAFSGLGTIWQVVEPGMFAE